MHRIAVLPTSLWKNIQGEICQFFKKIAATNVGPKPAGSCVSSCWAVDGLVFNGPQARRLDGRTAGQLDSGDRSCLTHKDSDKSFPERFLPFISRGRSGGIYNAWIYRRRVGSPWPPAPASHSLISRRQKGLFQAINFLLFISSSSPRRTRASQSRSVCGLTRWCSSALPTQRPKTQARRMAWNSHFNRKRIRRAVRSQAGSSPDEASLT